MKKILLMILWICFCLNILGAEEIPAYHTKIINSTVEKLFNVSCPESIERFTNGFSSPGLYKISVAGKAYVVRFNAENRSFEDNQRELDAMLVSAERGLAPKIIFASPMEGFLIMEFIDSSKQKEGFNPLSEENLHLLGQSIRQIHEGPVFKTAFSVFEMARSF